MAFVNHSITLKRCGCSSLLPHKDMLAHLFASIICKNMVTSRDHEENPTLPAALSPTFDTLHP